ncbi:hypothetical protein SETIT_3G112900v2 [Setaria italica]|nr:hypothetical protein SETIT_3G112900v2 [Setaria italica]
MQAAEVAAVVGKVAERLYAEDYDEHEDIAEESVAEVMRWLELEIKLAAGAASPPLPVALHATVGGGSWESCGPSMSKPASTVMASVDGRAGAPPPPAVPWPWPWPFPEPAARNEEEDDDDAADEWIAQLLTDGPAVEGQCGSK